MNMSRTSADHDAVGASLQLTPEFVDHFFADFRVPVYFAPARPLGSIYICGLQPLACWNPAGQDRCPCMNEAHDLGTVEHSIPVDYISVVTEKPRQDVS